MSKITINTQAKMCTGSRRIPTVELRSGGTGSHRTLVDCFPTVNNFFRRHITRSILGQLDGTCRLKGCPPADPPIIVGRGQPEWHPSESTPQSPEVLILPHKALSKGASPVLDSCKENPKGSLVFAAGLATNVSKGGVGTV